MAYNAIDPTATTFHRGVINRSGGRGGLRSFQTVKDLYGTDGFVHPFKLPETPDIPTWVGFRGGTGDTVSGGGGGPIAPTYQNPTLSIVANALSGEVGSIVNLVITPAWTQRDAGAAGQYRISNGGTDIHTAITPAAHTINNFQFTDAVQNIRAHVTHAAGPIKNDSEGNPYPAGQIQAGTVNSNIVNVIGFRKAFWYTAAGAVAAPTTSAEIRAYETTGFSSNNVATTKQVIIDLSTGTRTIIFAIPASLGSNILMLQQNAQFLGSLPPTSHGFTHSIVNVEDASGANPVAYNVYHQTVAAISGWPGTDRYTVSIS